MRRIFHRGLWTFARILAVGPPIILLIVSFLIVRRELDRSRGEILRLLTSEISSSLGLQISVRDVNASLPGRLSLKGLRIGKSGFGTLLTANRAVIRYGFFDLAQSLGSPASTVSFIDISGATVNLERSAKGQLNFAKAFTTKGGGKRLFRGVITVRSGTLYFTDHLPLSGSTKPMRVAARISGAQVDFRPENGGSFEGKIDGSSVSGPGSVVGAFDYKGKMALNAEGTDVSLPFISQNFIPPGSATLVRGKATGAFSVTLDMKLKRRVRFWASGHVNGADIVIAAPKAAGGPLHITNVNGQGRLAGLTSLSFDGAGQAFGAPWRARGTVVNLANPELWVEASSRSVDFRRLAALVPGVVERSGLKVSGLGGLDVTIRGRPSALTVSGKASAPAIAYAAWSASDARAIFDYQPGVIRVPRFSATFGKGEIAGFATAQLGLRLGVGGRARFSGVELSRIDNRVAGRASGNASFAVERGAPTASIQFQVIQPSFFGRKGTSALGQVRYRGGRIAVESFLASTPSGYLTVSGGIGLNGTLNLDVSGYGLDATDLVGKSLPALTSGTVRAAGHIAGTIRSPSFDGRIAAYSVGLAGRSIDSIGGDIVATKDKLSMTDVTVTRGAADTIISGEILEPLSNEPRLNLNATFKAADMADLEALVPVLAGVGGRLSGSVENITGTLRSLSADFDVKIEDAHRGPYSVSYASAKGHYDRGGLTLKSLTAKRSGAILVAQGKMSRTGLLDFSFDLRGLPASEALFLTLERAAPLAGTLDIAGQLGGTLVAPSVSASLTTHDLDVVGEPIEVTGGEVAWSAGMLTVKNALMTIAGGDITLEDVHLSTRDEDSGLVSATIWIGKGGRGKSLVDISRLLTTVRGLGLMADIPDDRVRSTALATPEHLQGALAGELKLTRRGRDVVADVDASLSGVQAWGAKLGTITLSATFEPTETRLKSLTVIDKDMQLKVSGQVGSNGKLDADIEGFNVVFASIPGLKVPPGVTGQADLSFRASGTLQDPRIEGSLYVSNTVIGGAKIDQFTTGVIVVTKNSIALGETSIASGHYAIRLGGTLPYSITGMDWVKGEPVDLRVELEKPSLEALALFSDRVDVKQTHGTAEGELTVTGLYPDLNVAGFVRVADGQLALKGMDTILKNIQVDVEWTGKEATIRRFQLSSSDGGTLTASGGVTTGLQGLQVKAAAKTRDFRLRFKNLSGVYQESYNGAVDADLAASGAIDHMLLQGAVTAHDGIIGLPVFPETPPKTSAASSFSPSLNISLNAGKNVRVRGPRMNAEVRGQLTASNTLANPALTGTLEVPQGYLLFPGSRFRVVPTGLITFRYDPPNPTRIVVNLRAETTIMASGASQGAGTSTSYRVEMSVQGPLDSPNVTFRSFPPGLGSNSIITMLGQQAGIGPGGIGSQASFDREVAQLFTANIAPGVLEPFESALAGAFGFSEVAFEFGQLEPLSVQVQRRLFGGFTVTYWRTLGSVQEQSEWTLGYSLTRQLSLTYGKNRFGATSPGLTGYLVF